MQRPIDRVLSVTLMLGLGPAGCGDENAKGTHPAPGEGVFLSGGSTGRGGASATAEGGAPASGGNTGAGDTAGIDIGMALRINVTRDAPTLVQLSSASVVRIDGDYRASAEWDLAFQGWDVFTNGGVSGLGKGAAFGPLSFTYFVFGDDPTDIPFLIEDKTAGAFRDWYLYDGESHALYSRFHTYGAKRGARLFKVQISGYYGEVQGAPISALYQLQYAEVTSDGSGPLVTVANLNATAGGLGGGADEPGTCLSLGTGEQQKLAPKAAVELFSWDLCFRRDTISVNGGLGGPGEVVAVDLDAAKTERETLDATKALTAEGEIARFEAVDYEALIAPGLKYHGDRIASAFTDGWVNHSKTPAELPEDSTWLVVGADGMSRFLIAFTGLQGSTADAAGTVVLRIQRVR